MAVGTAVCDHSLDNQAFFPNLSCSKLQHNPAPFIRAFMTLTTEDDRLAEIIRIFSGLGPEKQSNIYRLLCRYSKKT